MAPDAADQAPLAPPTAAGRLALASLPLMAVVILAGASLATTVPVGVVMLALATFARLGRGDRSTLLALPLVFGVWLAVGAIGGQAQGNLSSVQTNDNAAFLPASAESTQAAELARDRDLVVQAPRAPLGQ